MFTRPINWADGLTFEDGRIATLKEFMEEERKGLFLQPGERIELEEGEFEINLEENPIEIPEVSSSIIQELEEKIDEINLDLYFLLFDKSITRNREKRIENLKAQNHQAYQELEKARKEVLG